MQIIPVQTLAKCLRRRLAQLHGISVLDVKKLEAFAPQVLRVCNGRVGAHPGNSDIAKNNRSLQDSATFSIFIWHL